MILFYIKNLPCWVNWYTTGLENQHSERISRSESWAWRYERLLSFYYFKLTQKNFFRRVCCITTLLFLLNKRKDVTEWLKY